MTVQVGAVNAKKGSVLVTPPGWYHLISVLNNADAICIRTSFLAVGKAAKTNIIATTVNDEAKAQQVQPWLDLLEAS